MKPVYLDMTAFGPYAGRQVIDFWETGSCFSFTDRLAQGKRRFLMPCVMPCTEN